MVWVWFYGELILWLPLEDQGIAGMTNNKVSEVSIVMGGTPIDGWFKRGNHTKMDDGSSPNLGNPQIGTSDQWLEWTELEQSYPCSQQKRWEFVMNSSRSGLQTRVQGVGEGKLLKPCDTFVRGTWSGTCAIVINELGLQLVSPMNIVCIT